MSSVLVCQPKGLPSPSCNSAFALNSFASNSAISAGKLLSIPLRVLGFRPAPGRRPPKPDPDTTPCAVQPSVCGFHSLAINTPQFLHIWGSKSVPNSYSSPDVLRDSVVFTLFSTAARLQPFTVFLTVLSQPKPARM